MFSPKSMPSTSLFLHAFDVHRVLWDFLKRKGQKPAKTPRAQQRVVLAYKL
jgi:hypothetical protein